MNLSVRLKKSLVSNEIKQIFLLLDCLIFKGHRISNGKDGVLVLFPGKLGTGILFCGFIDQLEKYGMKHKVPITILTSKGTATFLSEWFQYIKCDGIYDEGVENDTKLLRSIANAYKGKQYEYIMNVCNGCFANSMLMKLVRSKHYATLLDTGKDSISLKRIIKKRLFLSLHDFIIETNQDVSYLQDWENMLSLLWNWEFKRGLYNFSSEELSNSPTEKNINIVKNNYCVVSPGSSLQFKCWPYERFAETIKHILRNTDSSFLIVIVGDKLDKDLSQKIINKICKDTDKTNEERIIDLSGVTSFKEWIGVIRNSKFLIGNDSAAVHMAASVGTKYLCIKGQWVKNKFLPHIVDTIPISESKIVSCEQMKCSPCRSPKTNVGINALCDKAKVSGNACPCVDGVSTTEVIENVDLFI